MTSYLINLEAEDTLKVDFNREISASGEQIVRDAEVRLNELIKSGELSGGKLLKIWGPISVPVTYVLVHRLAHLYSAIAFSDTRLKAYVVSASTTPDYPVGSRIDFESDTISEVEPDNHTVSSFLIYWNQNILNTEINSEIKVEGDQLVRDAEANLNELINSGQIKGGKQPLLINGRSTTLVGFVMAHQLAHLYGTIAVYDPKIAEPGLDKYIVVISHNGDQVGETIDVKRNESYGIKVGLCGEAHTGKTCLREGLKKALLTLPNAPHSYVFSGCPDGEGAWFYETVQKDPELARQLKEEYKAKFTPKFAQDKAQEIKAIQLPILVFDVGGKITSENETIMSEATHAVILAKSEEGVKAWQQFCEKLNVPVIAILNSDYEATQDRVDTDSPILKGTVHYLDRGEDTSTRPLIQKLAQYLVNLLNTSG